MTLRHADSFFVDLKKDNMPWFGKSFSPHEILASTKSVLCQRLGQSLISLIHYGNHLDPSLNPQPGDKIQLLIVLRNIDAKTMNELADAFSSIKGKKQVAPMVMTVAEIESSADVFPTTFQEMKYHHQLVYGEDVLESVEIPLVYLRLRCEQELKNLLLRLQAGYLNFHNRSKHLRTLFHNGIQTLVKAFHSIQVLFGKPFQQDRDELIKQSIADLELDEELVKRILQLDNQNRPVNLDAIHHQLMGLIEVVAAAAASVDRIPDQVELMEVIEE